MWSGKKSKDIIISPKRVQFENKYGTLLKNNIQFRTMNNLHYKVNKTMDENKLIVSNERSKHKRISSNQTFLTSNQHQRSLKNISERKDLEIYKIECGSNYSFFIERGTGKVFVCGYNKLNNLGFLQEHINQEIIETPIPNGLTGIEKIATDTHSTIMWSNKKKKLFFWGKNNFYKLGVNHRTESVSGESQMVRLNTSIENKGNLFRLTIKIRK